MSATNNISKHSSRDEKNQFSFRDFVPQIVVTQKNKQSLTISTYVKRRFVKYCKTNGAHSYSHGVHMLVSENSTLKQICFKLNIAIKRAVQENNVNFLIRIFADLATPEEKAYYDAINRGLLD